LQKKNINGTLALAKEYRKEKNIDNILITLSEYGVLIVNENSDFHIPAEKRDISDVSGAGDTVISTISLCLACGMPINIATQIANISGGLVCEKIGVVPVDKQQLLEECERIIGVNKD
jgi:bifunctional ADP-heptose synthase (sugar kinase/adenylyltransferase)